MATEAEIYDYESAIESAVKALFTADEVTCYTPADDPEFQRSIPRVELQVIAGPATGHIQLLTLDGEHESHVYDSWTGALLIACITKAQHAEHVSYRAHIRAKLARVRQGTMDHHNLIDLTPAGTTPMLKPQEGIYESRLTYSIAFCVKKSAWPN